MPEPEFDPLIGLSQDDREYIDGHKTAFQRQAVAHGLDDERLKASDAHRRATQEALGVSTSSPLPPLAQVVGLASQSGVISILIGTPELASSKDIPSTKDKFAPDWETMKQIISKYDGVWTVRREEFPGNAESILGFFGKEGWPKPADSEKEKFEVIVRSGMVFRADPVAEKA